MAASATNKQAGSGRPHLVVDAVRKRLFGGREVEALQRVLGEQPPQPRVRVLGDKAQRVVADAPRLLLLLLLLRLLLCALEQRARVPVICARVCGLNGCVKEVCARAPPNTHSTTKQQDKTPHT